MYNTVFIYTNSLILCMAMHFYILVDKIKDLYIRGNSPICDVDQAFRSFDVKTCTVDTQNKYLCRHDKSLFQ